MDKGANANEKGPLCSTPLMSAASEGHKEVCELLLERGAKADAESEFGYTASNLAKEKGHHEIVGILNINLWIIESVDSIVIKFIKLWISVIRFMKICQILIIEVAWLILCWIIKKKTTTNKLNEFIKA